MRSYINIFTMLCLASPALAVGTRGGGSTINYQVVENYAKNIEDISGYNEVVAPELAQLKAAVPNFERLLRERMAGLVFYVVPRAVLQLPPEQTGLHFETEQAAFQENGEVFISAPLFNLMSTAQKGTLLFHEIVEAYRFSISRGRVNILEVMEDTRVLVSWLRTRKPIEAEALKKILEQRNFGRFLSSADLLDIKKLEEKFNNLGPRENAVYCDAIPWPGTDGPLRSAIAALQPAQQDFREYANQLDVRTDFNSLHILSEIWSDDFSHYDRLASDFKIQLKGANYNTWRSTFCEAIQQRQSQTKFIFQKLKNL